MAFLEVSCIALLRAQFREDRSGRTPQPPAILPPPQHALLPNHFPGTLCTATAMQAIRPLLFFQLSPAPLPPIRLESPPKPLPRPVRQPKLLLPYVLSP